MKRKSEELIRPLSIGTTQEWRDQHQKERLGPVPSIGKQVKDEILNMMRTNDRLTLKEMEEKLTEKGLKGSHQSIWLYLKSQEYRSTDPIEVKMLSNKHKKDRLDWWEANKDTDWEKVVFTDETDFKLGSMKTKRWMKKDQQNTTIIKEVVKEGECLGCYIV